MIKTRQFKHQETIYLEHRDREYFGLFWEMGLGKSKLMLDVAAHHFEQNRVSGLLVVAPNDVYRNWTRQEIPAHLGPENLSLAYPKGDTNKDEMLRLMFMDPLLGPDKLRVLCMSYDNLCTDHGMSYAMEFATTRDCMVVADESTQIKSAKAARSVAMKELGAVAKFRWIATGTPITQDPFDLHSQIEFLDPEFWARFGMATMGAFKTQFANLMLTKERGRRFYQVESFRNLDVLRKIIQPISSRLLKEDSGVELPPKLYSTKTFELTREQLTLYHSLRTKYVAEVEAGLRCEAPLAIVRLTRLQQIACGFLTVEEDDANEELEGMSTEDLIVLPTKKFIADIIPPKRNPRVLLLQEIIAECSHKMIVWCRFKHDVQTLADTLGDNCLRYDGKVSNRDRAEVLERFRDPKDSAQVLVANTAAMAYGVTLTIAKTAVYYSNMFSLEKRLQSEDRAHRIGQDQNVLIIDLAAENTVDERIIQILKSKWNIAAEVAGDKFREWL